MDSTSIKQKTITLEFDSSKVVIRRMYWKAAKNFLKMLAKHVGGLGNNLADVLPKLPEVIASVDELTTFLVINSSDLDAAAFDNLDVVQAAAVLNASIELNCGPELKNSFAGIVATLAGLMPAVPSSLKTSTGDRPTPSSSTPGTPLTT